MKTLASGHCGLKNVAKYVGEIGFAMIQMAYPPDS